MTLKNSKKQEEISSTKLSIPTAGALEYRTTMYPVGKKPELSTVYGEVRFEKGQLSSRDRDYIDAIMAHAEKARINPAGELAVVFDAAKVRKSLGFSTKTNWYKLYQRLVDIKSIKLSIRRPDDDWPTSFSLISSVGGYPLVSR